MMESSSIRPIAPEAVRKRIQAGGIVLGAYTEGQILGAVEMRRPDHIALLFVDKRYQRRGISRALLNRGIAALLTEDASVSSITVNASPYSVPVDQRLGYEATDRLQEKDGIKFVPMEKGLE